MVTLSLLAFLILLVLLVASTARPKKDGFTTIYSPGGEPVAELKEEMTGGNPAQPKTQKKTKFPKDFMNRAKIIAASISAEKKKTSQDQGDQPPPEDSSIPVPVNVNWADELKKLSKEFDLKLKQARETTNMDLGMTIVKNNEEIKKGFTDMTVKTDARFDRQAGKLKNYRLRLEALEKKMPTIDGAEIQTQIEKLNNSVEELKSKTTALVFNPQTKTTEIVGDVRVNKPILSNNPSFDLPYVKDRKVVFGTAAQLVNVQPKPNQKQSS